MIVHPGSFGPDGATGVTIKGTPMLCSPKTPGARARWRRAGATPTTQDSNEPRVLKTVARLLRATKPATYVSIAVLRDELADVPRDTMDALLRDMDKRRVIQLDPDPNRKAISERAKAAAIWLGGEDMHLISA
jgi:hypothetical protein